MIWCFLARQFLRSWARQRCSFPPCVSVVMGVVMSLHSSLELQIQRCSCHSSLVGQRPERQRLQPVGRRRRGERSGQCHLPGAPIVSRLILQTQRLCFTFLMPYKGLQPSMWRLLCGDVIYETLFLFSSVERSQMVQTWWNHQWDTVILKVRQIFTVCVCQNCHPRW